MIGITPGYGVAVLDRFTGAPIDLGRTGRVEAISYGRRLTTVSEANVALAPAVMPDLRRLIAHPLRHVLAIWRGGVDPVWYGPVRQASETNDAVTIQADDITSWLAKRTLAPLARPLVGDIADVVAYILDAGLGGDDPIGHVAMIERADVVMTVTKWTGLRPYAASELRRLTATSMRVTVCGHRVFGWASGNTERGPVALVSPDQLSVSAAVTSTAVSQATVVWARSGSLIERWPPPGQVDQIDGLSEIVLDARALKDRGALRDYAADQWAQRHQPSVSLGLNDIVVLPPTFPVDFDQLVPGVRIGTTAPVGRNLSVGGIFELDRLDVTIGTPAGELPRDVSTGRFVAAQGSATETITAAWTPVTGQVTL